MKSQNIKLGFSTGILHKTHTTKEALKIMQNLGCNTVELGFVKPNRIKEGWLDEVSKEDIEGFSYISLHAPAFAYGKNEETKYIFEKIKKIDNIRKLNNVEY